MTRANTNIVCNIIVHRGFFEKLRDPINFKHVMVKLFSQEQKLFSISIYEFDFILKFSLIQWIEISIKFVLLLWLLKYLHRCWWQRPSLRMLGSLRHSRLPRSEVSFVEIVSVFWLWNQSHFSSDFQGTCI